MRLKDARCLLQGWSSSWKKTARLEDQSPLLEGSPGTEGRLWPLPVAKAFPHRGFPHFQKGILPSELSSPSGHRVHLDGSPPQSCNTHRSQAPQESLVTCVTVSPCPFPLKQEPWGHFGQLYPPCPNQAFGSREGAEGCSPPLALKQQSSQPLMGPGAPTIHKP